MSFKTETVLRTIKFEMKSRRLSYARLAQRLGLSLSGVKKILNGKDLSLLRLQQLAEAIELSVVEILSAADDEKVQDVHLTPAQESLLLRDKDVFHFYWKVRIEGWSIQDYRSHYRRPRTEIKRILRALEKATLLRYLNDGTVEFLHRGMIRWQGRGPLVQHLNRQWSAQLIDEILNGESNKNFLNLSSLSLHPHSLQRFRLEMEVLLERLSAQAKKDKLNFRSQNLKKMAFLIAFSEHDFVP